MVQLSSAEKSCFGEKLVETIPNINSSIQAVKTFFSSFYPFSKVPLMSYYFFLMKREIVKTLLQEQTPFSANSSDPFLGSLRPHICYSLWTLLGCSSHSSRLAPAAGPPEHRAELSSPPDTLSHLLPPQGLPDTELEIGLWKASLKGCVPGREFIGSSFLAKRALRD